MAIEKKNLGPKMYDVFVSELLLSITRFASSKLLGNTKCYLLHKMIVILNVFINIIHRKR